MTTKYTLQDALAFIAITGSKKFLTMKTRIAVMDYSELNTSGDLCQYEPNEEGMKLARNSRTWKAHQHMLELGLSFDRRVYHQKPSFIHYTAEDDGRHGFISQGGVFISAAGEWSSNRIAKFKNGMEK